MCICCVVSRRSIGGVLLLFDRGDRQLIKIFNIFHDNRIRYICTYCNVNGHNLLKDDDLYSQYIASTIQKMSHWQHYTFSRITRTVTLTKQVCTWYSTSNFVSLDMCWWKHSFVPGSIFIVNSASKHRHASNAQTSNKIAAIWSFTDGILNFDKSGRKCRRSQVRRKLKP
jgi:hypothetical protein